MIHELSGDILYNAAKSVAPNNYFLHVLSLQLHERMLAIQALLFTFIALIKKASKPTCQPNLKKLSNFLTYGNWR